MEKLEDIIEYFFEDLSEVGQILIFTLGFFLISFILTYPAVEREKTIENNHNEITFYLDGEEVEYENIDLSLYQYTFNEEENKVFLTKKP